MDQKNLYLSLVGKVSEIMDKADPANIHGPEGEYEQESGEIARLLLTTNNKDEMNTELKKILLESFGNDSINEKEDYSSLVEELMEAKRPLNN